MSDDQITTQTAADGATHTTVVTGNSGGGGKWVLGLLVLILIGVGVYFFAGMANSEATKNDAITQAAKDVGNAAENVGAAADEVGDAAKDATDTVKKN